MDFAKVEKFSKKMELWHNRIFKWVCIGVFVLFSDVVAIGIVGWSNYSNMALHNALEPFAKMTYDVVINGGGIFILIFMCYTILFTKFQFPIRFSGNGKGRKYDPPTVNQ